MKKKFSYGPLAVAALAVVAVIIALPAAWKPAFLPPFLSPAPHLGLDLAGGTQLDFRISEEEIIKRQEDLEKRIDDLEVSGTEEELVVARNELASLRTQHEHIVEAIRTVLERRINALGVSEATITPSYYGSEKHLLVDCPGVIDIQRCIQTVGKTIQLEFKEEFTEASDEYKAQVRTKAETTFESIRNGQRSLQVAGQDLSSDLGVQFVDAQYFAQSDLPNGLEQMWNRSPSDPAVMQSGVIQVVGLNAEGQQELQEIEGIYIAEVVAPIAPGTRTIENPSDALAELKNRASGAVLVNETNVQLSTLDQALQTQLSTQEIGTTATVTSPENGVVYLSSRIDGDERADVSHILVAYEGAERADADVTRTKEEAKTRAEQLKAQLDGGADFATLARTESDGPSAEQAGKLDPIGKGDTAAAFEAAAFALSAGETSDVVETSFGFHIIKANANVQTTGTTVSYAYLRLPGISGGSQAQDFLKQINEKTVTKTEDQITLRVLFFSLEPTGWKDTELNGQHFRSAAVTVDPYTNIPVVQIQFDSEGARLFQELTKSNIGKQIAIFVGGELVSAPTVQSEISGGTAIITGSQNFDEAQALAIDLNTGAIPAPIFLSGQNTIQPTLGANALADSLLAGLIGFAILCFALIAIYRFLGVIASLALLLYFVLLLALMKLPLFLVTDDYIVITLAGIAGIILSIGMAVDANILIFERMKEEVKRGKAMKTAAMTGFKRAWPSIRDGNMTTLISCMVLIVIGTSIVRGFAITLALGIFVALFCSLVVTKWLLEKALSSPLAEHEEYFLPKKSRGHHDA